MKRWDGRVEVEKWRGGMDGRVERVARGKWYNTQLMDMSGEMLVGRASKASQMDGLARLSSSGSYSMFSYGDDVIRFATSPRLVKYTRIKQWDDGYLEVGADYGKGEVEDYIDMRAILDNLYYDTDAFLSKIDKVEVAYE